MPPWLPVGLGGGTLHDNPEVEQHTKALDTVLALVPFNDQLERWHMSSRALSRAFEVSTSWWGWSPRKLSRRPQSTTKELAEGYQALATIFKDGIAGSQRLSQRLAGIHDTLSTRTQHLSEVRQLWFSDDSERHFRDGEIDRILQEIGRSSQSSTLMRLQLDATDEALEEMSDKLLTFESIQGHIKVMRRTLSREVWAIARMGRMGAWFEERPFTDWQVEETYEEASESVTALQDQIAILEERGKAMQQAEEASLALKRHFDECSEGETPSTVESPSAELSPAAPSSAPESPVGTS